MFERLNAIVDKFNELQTELTNPDIISDYNKLKTLSKESSDLEETVKKYQEYKDTEAGIEDAKTLMKDDELKEMATLEYESLKEKLEVLTKELEILLVPKDENDGKNVIISQNNDYRFSFINELTAGSTTNILPSLNYGEDSGIVSLSGTLSGNITKSFPVLDTAQFFTGKLRKALDNNGISYSRQFYAKRTPVDAKRIASFRRPLREVLCFILKTSDNFAAEVVFKVAAAKWAEKTLNSFETDKAAGEDVKNKSRIATINSSYGTLYNGKLMFFEYYDKAGLDTGKINLKDASGVSRYNALKTSWMVDALIYLDKNSKIREYMITADEGTLKRRMRDLKGNLKAKTGTIFGVSSLVGYVSSMEGVNYAFSIIIQNFGEKSSVVKGLEDDIVHGIYFLE